MNLTLTYQNQEATRPLVIPLQVICNTEEDEILSNVLVNSKRIKKWVKTLPAHDRIAIVCGSGPSLADSLYEIRSLAGDVFALNNAARYLHDRGYTADYQIIMDAQPKTIDLVGPAKHHLFASMVNPALFDKVPEAILWHATHGDRLVDEQEGFPKHDDDYALIGGGATVGNTSLPLLYALGYRTIHIFGMDSSHRAGESHVLTQSINDGDPCMLVEFNGKEYICSFTMKTQADHFIRRARDLEKMGCKIELHGDGYLPALWRERKEFESEQAKYEELYRLGYGLTSPGARIARTFVDVVKPKAGMRLVDYGCGSGLGTLELRHLTPCEIIQVDFANNCRCSDAKNFEFIQHDLTAGKIPVSADYGFCSDVLEHIEPEKVDAAIKNIMDSCLECFFQISTVNDVMGDIIGHELHLTVQPHEWWREKFLSLGYVVKWESKEPITACFHIGLTT